MFDDYEFFEKKGEGAFGKVMVFFFYLITNVFLYDLFILFFSLIRKSFDYVFSNTKYYST